MKLTEVPDFRYNDDVISKRKDPKKPSTMFIVFKELFFIFALLITAYATFVNLQSKTNKGPPPTPFFQHPNVKDFYEGELSELMQEIPLHHYAFVMYYAPWDADSQDAKAAFIETSIFYGDRVYFASVNCWEPSSECRSTFKEVISPFPQLVAYVGPSRAVEYKGPHSTDHMIKFLHSVRHPMARINSVPELWELKALHDAVLVGHFKFHEAIPSRGFNVLYGTALQLATRDHERHVAIAYFTHLGFNRLLGLDDGPTIVLYLWNQRIPYRGKADVEELTKWVAAQAAKGLPELNSNTLLPHVKSGAIMVMFTPRHPLATMNPYYHLFRRVAMNFNHCRNGTRSEFEDEFFSYVLQYKSLYPSGFEQAVLAKDGIVREKCRIRRKLWKQQELSCNSVAVSTHWDNMTCSKLNGHCRRPPRNLKSVEDFTFFSLLKQDESDAERVAGGQLDEQCLLLERTPPPLVPKESPYVGQIPTYCQTNQTFTFIALDSSSYSHLANGLGLQLQKVKHRTSVVIFDNEEVLKLNTTDVTEKSVVDLLKRYLAGERQRPLRSVMDTVNFHNSIKEKQAGEAVSLLELNTHDFDSVALNETQNVVVMYHSPYCSFCLSLSNIFLSLSHFLRQVKSLTFARIDGELNDLPWQYTVPTYPSVLFFPARRKAESRIFPHKLPLTMHSLSSFIVLNLKNYERISVMLALCSRWGSNPLSTLEGEMCLKDVRKYLMDGVAETLHDYRLILLRLKMCSSSSSCLEGNYLDYRLKRTFAVLEYLKIAHLHLFTAKDIPISVSYLENVKARIIVR